MCNKGIAAGSELQRWRWKLDRRSALTKQFRTTSYELINVDEILYHSRIHPEQRTNTLSAAQMKVLYEKMKFVCETAVAVNADHTKFPDDWLYSDQLRGEWSAYNEILKRKNDSIQEQLGAW